MTACNDPSEGKAISLEDERRVRELFDPETKAGRVCLRMLDHGQTIVEASAIEGIDPVDVMASWHAITDENGILSTDGRKPCISVLENAWKRRWESDNAPVWAPADPMFASAPLARPFMRG